MRVLVVDDDPGVRNAIVKALGYEGYEVAGAGDGLAALDALRARPADLIVLDVAMPHLDGIGLCRRLRAAGDRTPILMLTAKTALADRVDGLDAGADDYLVKPFELEELLARVRAQLRRAGDAAHPLRVGDLVIDPHARRCRRGEREIVLTRTEFNLLELLMQHEGRVLTREVLLERIWGFDFATSSNTLDVYIGYLRRKIERPEQPKLIHTVRGVGFLLRQAEGAT